MATATLLTSGYKGWNTASEASFTTASITPGANCLLVLLWVGVMDVNGATTAFTSVPTSSGSGPTWTSRASDPADAPFDYQCAVWTATIGGTDPGSFTITGDYRNAETCGARSYFVYKVTGHDTGTPTGGTLAAAAQAGDGAESGTLSAAPATADIVLAASGADATAGAGGGISFNNTARTWTLDSQNTTPSIEAAGGCGQSTGSTSTTVAFTDVNTGSGNFTSAQVAIVIKAGTVTPDVGGSPTVVNVRSAVGAVTATTELAGSPTVVTAVSAAGAITTVPTVLGVQTVITAASAVAALTATAALNGAATVVTTVAGTATITIPADVPFATDISGRKILDQNGDVYPMLTAQCWAMAMNLSNAEITEALEGLAGAGFNAVTVWFGGGYDLNGSWHPYTNDAGANWWTVTPWQATSTSGGGFGPAWSSADWVVSETLRLGLTLNLSICGGFGDTGARPDWQAATNTQMQNVGASIANRYPVATYPHIVWHVMFDDNHDSTTIARIQAYFAGVNSVETSTGRPVRWEEPNNGSTAFTQSGAGGASVFTNFGPTMNSAYDYGSNSAEIAEATYAEVAIPWGDCEPRYVGNSVSDAQLRENTLCGFFEGAAFMAWGHENLWPFGATGLFDPGLDWDEVAASPQAVQQGIALELVKAYVADASWAPTSSFVTTGAGSGDTKAGIGASSTAALAYFPNSRTIAVDTTILAGTGPVRLRWWDPSDGSFTSIATSEAQQTGRSVTHPGNSSNSDGDSDWVLVVDLVPAIGATGTVVTVVSAAGNVGAGATINGHGTVVQARAAVANIGGAATLNGHATIVNVAAGTGDVQTGVITNGSPTVVQVRAATATITATAVVVGHATIVQTRAAVANVNSGDGNITPHGTFVRVFSAVGHTDQIPIVDDVPSPARLLAIPPDGGYRRIPGTPRPRWLGGAATVKDPDATLDYPVDWGYWLDDDDELAGVEVTIKLPNGNTPVPGTGLEIDGDIELSTGGGARVRYVLITLTGGTVGKWYGVTFSIETANGLPDDRTRWFRIRQR